MRSYEYYKTRSPYSSSHPTFKVKFTLIGYNDSSNAAIHNTYDTEISDHDSSWGLGIGGTILGLFAVTSVLGIIIGMYVLIARMAKKRNRDPAVWVLLSFVFSPFLIIFILLIAGHSHNQSNNIY